MLVWTEGGDGQHERHVGAEKDDFCVSNSVLIAKKMLEQISNLFFIDK